MRDSLYDIARTRAQREPDRRAFLHLRDGERDEIELDYAALDLFARRIAAELQARLASPSARAIDGRAEGERVLLLFPHGLDFVAAFLGCVYAGAVAVPTDPPRRNRPLERTAALLRDCRPAAVLTVAALEAERERLTAQAPGLADLEWIAVDALGPGSEDGWRERRPAPGETAFLQYTSGSTGTPRGVRVSHANLAHNLALLREALLLERGSRIVSWLPLHHDMGLIGMALEALFVGAPCVLLSPAHFLARPARWLEAVTRFRATMTGGPNFAYDLCVERIGPAERAALDLASLTRAFNGAEPVRAETLERFAAAFAPAGLARAALYPGYGLAEATLVVSGGGAAHAGPRELRLDARALERGGARPATDGAPAKRVVGCGRVLGDQELAIVDPERRARLAERAVGEIWVRGPSIAQGYWDRSQGSGTFGARIAGEASGPWLRTGDLGLLDGGELYVTGRLKDMLVLRGENHYPQDLELTAAHSHPDLRAEGAAAFAIEREPGGEERLALVLELERRPSSPADAVLAAIRRAVGAAHDVAVEAIALIRPGALPRTTSGKVRRSAARERWLAGTLPVVAAWRAPEDPGAALARVGPPDGRGADEIERWLAALAAALVGTAPAEIDRAAPLGALGLDSLGVIEIARRVESEIGIELSLAPLFAGASLREIARDLARAPRAAPVPEPAALDPDGVLPQTWGQRALWFLRRLEPESGAYHLALAFRVPAGFDAPAFERALALLVARHAALRATFFESEDGEPLQRVHARLAVPLERVDASGWDEASLLSRMADEARRPFALETQGPLRAMLLADAGTPVALLVLAHHIAVDHASFAVIAAELSAAYAGELDGAPQALPSADAGPAELVRAERAAAQGPEAHESEAFWRAKLARECPALEPCADRRRPARPARRGATLRADLGPDLLARVRGLARATGTTPFLVCLAAFEAAMHAASGRAEFLFGTLASGRDRPGRTGAVGYLVDPLVLRADLAGDPTFLTVLERARRDVADSLAHRALPFPALVERLAPARDAARNPFFQVLFAWQHAHRHAGTDLAPFALGGALGGGGARLALGPIELESIALPGGPAPFDQSWMLAEVEGAGGPVGGTGLALALEYDVELYECASVERLAHLWRRTLERALERPELPIAELLGADEGERAALAALWDGGPPAAEADIPVTELVERRARELPGAIALVCAGRSVAYAELELRAERLARELGARGIGPGALVALSAPRSIELVVALLAVLKAGAAFLPLDARLPAARRRRLIEASGAVLLLQLPAGEDAAAPIPALALDESDAPPAGLPAAPPRARAAPDAPAYVMYTSGSTGEPKGVVIPRRALDAHVAAARAHFGLGREDRVLHMASIGFDLSIEELFPTLASGARLVIRSESAPPSADELGALVEREGVTVLDLPTAYWHEWVRALEASARPPPRPLRLVIVGGERASAAAYRAWIALASDVRWVNTYGPTESAVTATIAEAPAPGSLDAPLPIGRPVAGWRVGIVDARGRPAPPGAPGEIVIGGAGLAQGYLADPERTAERFVPDPLGAPPVAARGEIGGARVFRTGDRGRFRADGQLEFLGRDDEQVKVRGFRVEPAEAEAELAARRGVAAAAVVAVEGAGGRTELAGYVVPQRGLALDLDLVRAELARALPDYLVPATLTALDALPRTASGKLDRAALPRPTARDPGVDGEPRGDVERALARIVGDTLGLARVGRHDDFFELGGDSIQAIQVAARAARAGLGVTPSELFRLRTVAELARATAPRSVDAAPALPSAAGPLPLTPIQRWFFAQRFAHPAHWNQALVLETDRLPEHVDRALALLVERHDALRQRFRRDAGGWRAEIVARGERDLALERLDLAALAPEARDAAFVEACARVQRGLDLERGPLLAALVARLGPGRPERLLLAAHHLAVDAVSWRILVDELEQLLETHDAPLELPPVPVRWSDWARAGAAEPPDAAPPSIPADARPLPRDRDAGAGTMADERAVEVRLERRETDALFGASARLRAGIDELALAALAGALADSDRRPGVWIDVEGHGRDAGALDLSRTVGWFTTVVPLWIELGATRSAAAALRAARRAARAVRGRERAITARRYGAAGGEGARPQPEVLFNFLGRLDGALGRTPRFRFVSAALRTDRAPCAARSHLLEVDLWVLAGQLVARCSYSCRAHDEGSVRALAEGFRARLRELAQAEHAESAPEPADFPLARLSRRELDNVLGRLAPDPREP